MSGLTPPQVSQWLSSMLNIIPGDVLSSVAHRVKVLKVDGIGMSVLLNNHELATGLGVEGLTNLHCSRIRKVWHQDYPETRTIQSDPRDPRPRDDLRPREDPRSRGDPLPRDDPRGDPRRDHHPRDRGDPRDRDRGDHHPRDRDNPNNGFSRGNNMNDPRGSSRGLVGIDPRMDRGDHPRDDPRDDPQRGGPSSRGSRGIDPRDDTRASRYLSSKNSSSGSHFGRGEFDNDMGGVVGPPPGMNNRELVEQLRSSESKLMAKCESMAGLIEELESKTQKYQNQIDILESRNRAAQQQIYETTENCRKVFERVCEQAGLDKAVAYPWVRDLLQPGQIRQAMMANQANQSQKMAQTSGKGGHGGPPGGGVPGGGMGQMPPGGGMGAKGNPSGGGPYHVRPESLGGRNIGDPFDTVGGREIRKPNVPNIGPNLTPQGHQMNHGSNHGGSSDDPNIKNNNSMAPNNSSMASQGSAGPVNNLNQNSPPIKSNPSNLYADYDELPAAASKRGATSPKRLDRKVPGSKMNTTRPTSGGMGSGGDGNGFPAGGLGGLVKNNNQSSSLPTAAPGSTSGPNISQQQIENNSSNNKSPSKIIDWVRSLPDAFVPERVKEDMCAAIGSKNIGGAEFSQLVLNNQLSVLNVVSPVQVSKIVKSWKNVLQEDAMAQAANATKTNGVQKAVKLIC